MNRKFQIVIFSILLLSGTFISQPIQSRIESVLNDSLFSVSQIGIQVYDLTEDENIFTKNENLLLHPASNMKLFTSAAALLYLSPQNYFETKFFYDGSIKDSVLEGNLSVQGGFDPMFTTSDLDTVVYRLKKLGIKKLNGDLIADVSNIDSLHFGKGWMWDDNPSAFMPYLSSICINKNAVKIYYEPAVPGEKAELKLEPRSDYYSVENNLITTDEDTSDIEIKRDWLNNKNTIHIRGDISYKKSLDSASTNIFNPTLYFLYLLKEKLYEEKIHVNGELRTGITSPNEKVLLIKRRNIIEIINEMNKESDNLNAEMLIRKISREKFTGTASAEKGLRYLDSLTVLLNHLPKTYVFADGSGLSHYNLVSAALLIDLLKYLYKEQPELYGHFYESLPIGGVDGTLEDRMKYGKAYKNVHAKTGTISGVSTLSGFLTSANNHLIAFSILIQNYSGSAKRARKLQDEICNILSEYK